MFLGGAVILAAGFWIYRTSLGGPFAGDDVFYLTNNPLLHDPARLWKAWFSPGSFIEYYPIEQTVQYFQWQAWGNDTLGYRLTNLVLHLASSLLVWRLLSKFHLRFAWLAGFLFAIHPLQVESVASISELKNTLSLPPLLLAMGYWIDYANRGARRDYYRALGCFVFAMLCKDSVAPFPVLLLLYAWWKKGRITQKQMAESVPFFAVALVLGLLTILSGHWYGEHATTTFASAITIGPPLSRLALVGTSAAWYFAHFFWPTEPLPAYPRWSVDPPAWWQGLPWILLFAVGANFWMRPATWKRHVVLGMGFFLLFLAPILGFFAISFMQFTWVMDHFLYLPMIGLIGLLVAGLECFLNRLPERMRPLAIAVFGALFFPLAWTAHGYAETYSDPPKLYAYVFEHNPGSWIAHEQYGQYLLGTGRSSDAISQFEVALAGNSDYPTSHYLLALALVQQRRFDEAEIQYLEAIRLRPTFAPFYDDYGSMLFQRNHVMEAMAYFQKAVGLAPGWAKAHVNLGSALVQQGNVAGGIAQYRTALEIEPNSVAAHLNLGIAYAEADRKAEAITEFEEVLKLDPGNPVATSELDAVKQ